MDYHRLASINGATPATKMVRSLQLLYWLRGASWRAGVTSGRLWRVAAAWQARYTQRRDLAELDDFRLDDIGVTRTEARAEAGLAFWRAMRGMGLAARSRRTVGRWRLAGAFRRYYWELQALDDRMLSDAGVTNRGDLRMLARRAAIGAEIRRRRHHRLAR